MFASSDGGTQLRILRKNLLLSSLETTSGEEGEDDEEEEDEESELE